MSKILEVAKAFEKQSKAELQSTNETVQNAIKQHESDLIASFQSVNENLASVIQTEQVKLAKKLRRTFNVISLVMLLLMGAAVAGLTLWGAMEYAKMLEWKASAENYQKISKSLIISRCTVGDNKSQYCVEIDPSYKGKYWGDKGNIAILPIPTE